VTRTARTTAVLVAPLLLAALLFVPWSQLWLSSPVPVSMSLVLTRVLAAPSLCPQMIIDSPVQEAKINTLATEKRALLQVVDALLEMHMNDTGDRDRTASVQPLLAKLKPFQVCECAVVASCVVMLSKP
jgi:hypothetical protein